MKATGLLLALGILTGCATQWNHPGQDLCLKSDIYVSVDGNHGLSAGRYRYSHSTDYQDYYIAVEDPGAGGTIAKAGEPLTLENISVYWRAWPEIEVATEEQAPIRATVSHLHRCDS